MMLTIANAAPTMSRLLFVRCSACRRVPLHMPTKAAANMASQAMSVTARVDSLIMQIDLSTGFTIGFQESRGKRSSAAGSSKKAWSIAARTRATAVSSRPGWIGNNKPSAAARSALGKTAAIAR